jgi:hypothetical protein|tara:strand:+ start:64 stop:297 length:234 start_codon:yes stop_codon:yes gene_type:complete
MITLQRESMLTGNTSSMELNTTQEKIDIFFDESQKQTRPLIQNLFSELSEDEREFIQTGATPKEWAKIESEWDPRSS